MKIVELEVDVEQTYNLWFASRTSSFTKSGMAPSWFMVGAGHPETLPGVWNRDGRVEKPLTQIIHLLYITMIPQRRYAAILSWQTLIFYCLSCGTMDAWYL